MTTLSAYLEQENKRDKTVGLIISLIVHGIIAAVLILFSLKPPDPPLGSGEGMMIALGMPDEGGPDEAPALDNPETSVPEEPTPNEDENVSTQDVEETVSMKTDPDAEKKKPEEKSVEKKPEPVKEPERQVNARATFKGNPNGSPDSRGNGDGDKPGNHGDPLGDPNGSPDGTGSGDNGKGNDAAGPYQLSGRKVKAYPDIQDNSKATGKVVVTITVDRNGRVLKAVPGAPGSTTTDISLREKARQAALRTEFSPNPDAPSEQVGTMTFIFRYKP